MAAVGSAAPNQLTQKAAPTQRPGLSKGDISSMLEPGSFNLSASRRNLMAANRANSTRMLRTNSGDSTCDQMAKQRVAGRRAMLGNERSQSLRYLNTSDDKPAAGGGMRRQGSARKLLMNGGDSELGLGRSGSRRNLMGNEAFGGRTRRLSGNGNLLQTA